MGFDINVRFQNPETEALLHRVLTGLHALKEAFMAGVAELNAKIGELNQAVDEMKGRVQTDFDELKRLIAAGADTQPAIDALQATIDSLKGVDPLPAFPATV